jgi:hypothetical protein
LLEVELATQIEQQNDEIFNPIFIKVRLRSYSFLNGSFTKNRNEQ